MDKLQIIGTNEILGKKLPIIAGGFGQDQKCITDRMISEIHSMKTIHIRELIINNISRFKYDIDLIDLKGIVDTDTLESLGYSKQSISQARHLYLLSERGYAKLIKIMDSDKAWELHDIMMDEYFTMKEMIKTGNTQADLFTQLMTASMTAISQVLNENMTQLRQDIKDEFRQEKDKMKTIITDQEIVHGKQLQEARNLIGFKTKNTASLTKLLKAKLSQIKGHKVMADDYHYIMAKERLFKKYLVWNWEEIPVHRYDEIHADIDSIEDLEDLNF